MPLRRHKHKYVVTHVSRADTRGMVKVKYYCTNTQSYCDKRTKEQKESADKYQ